MQKHPTVQAWESKHGTECVTQGGHPFQLVPDEKDLPHDLRGNALYPALVSADETERGQGAPMQLCHGKSLVLAQVVEARDATFAARDEALSAKAAQPPVVVE